MFFGVALYATSFSSFISAPVAVVTYDSEHESVDVTVDVLLSDVEATPPEPAAIALNRAKCIAPSGHNEFKPT